MVFMDKIVKLYRWNYALVEELPERYVTNLDKQIERNDIINSERKFFSKVWKEWIDNAKDFFWLQAREYVDVFVKENAEIIRNDDLLFESKILISDLGFESWIIYERGYNRLVIKEVWRGNLADENIRMSDVIYRQLIQGGIDVHQIKVIELENVVNREILEIIEKYWLTEAEKIINSKWWNIWGLDRMINKIIGKIWKEVEGIKLRKYIGENYSWVSEIQYSIFIDLK